MNDPRLIEERTPLHNDFRIANVVRRLDVVTQCRVELVDGLSDR
jgi:hypothetical protein